MQNPISRSCLASVALALAWHCSASAADAPRPEPAPTHAGSTSAIAPSAIDPAGLLLFSVDLDLITLTDGLSAYGDPQDPLVPIGELTRLLQMDVDVFPSERRISGRIGEARRALLVDLPAGVARTGAQDVALASQDVAVTPTEIYLRASAVAKLLPLKLDILSEELLIKVTATELLPIQAKLGRMGNMPLMGRSGGSEEPVLRVETPYQLFSPPSADINLGLGARSETPNFPLRYDIRLASDLFYSNFLAYLASDQGGNLTSGRFLLERRSLSGGLLGPLHARELELGDTFSPGLAVGPRSVGGRGVMFSTTPLEQTSIFNRIDLRGELPVGYDVELYINDILRASQNTPNNGQYEFLDVPLSPGVNIVRTVLYSPRGERIEQTRVINVGAGLLRKGELHLDMGVVDQDVPLVDFVRGVETSLDPTTKAGGLRAVGSMRYGLTNFVTLVGGAGLIPHMAAAAAADPRREQSTVVGSFGVRAPLGRFSTQFDIAGDSHGGRAGVASFAGAYGGLAGALRHSEYSGGFLDENNVGASGAFPLQRRTEVTLDANLPLRGAILPVALRVVRNGYASGDSDWQAALRASSSIAGLLVSGGLVYDRRDPRTAPSSQELSGYLTASTFKRFSWQVRASLDFDFAPEFQAKTLMLVADRALSDNWTLQFALGEPLYSMSAFNLAASTSYRSRYGDFSLSANYDNGERSWEVLAQYNFGIGYIPDAGYRMAPTGPGSGGSALLDAFYDDDGDGLRGPQERAAPGIGIGGGVRKTVTDASGRAYITGLGSAPSARLALNLDSIQDTTFEAPPINLETSPRPGSVTRFNYPIRPTGAVTVLIMLQRDDGKKVGLSSVRVVLRPEKGDPILRTTEFDGSAVFDQVPLGPYKVELDAEQAKRLRMRMTSSPTVVIRADEFTSDVTADVKFEPASETASEKDPALTS